MDGGARGAVVAVVIRVARVLRHHEHPVAAHGMRQRLAHEVDDGADAMWAGMIHKELEPCAIDRVLMLVDDPLRVGGAHERHPRLRAGHAGRAVRPVGGVKVSWGAAVRHLSWLVDVVGRQPARGCQVQRAQRQSG